MLAENGLEETATAEDLLEDQIVRRRQVVEVVLGGEDLCHPRDLVAHAVTVDVLFGCFYLDSRFWILPILLPKKPATTTSVEKKKKKKRIGSGRVGYLSDRVKRVTVEADGAGR